MSTPRFDPERSAAIRAGLATKVEAQRWANAPGWRLLTPVAVAGLLVGGVATAVLAANLPRASEQTTASGDVPALPDGLLPGAPIVSLVGGPTSTQVSSPTQIPLSPPSGATDIRVSVTCLTTGMTTWGFDPGGNNPATSCADGERGDGWMDFPLDTGKPLYVSPQPGAEVIVTIQFLATVKTDWGVNAAGETYGVTKAGSGMPDLLAAYGTDGTLGYVRTLDLRSAGSDLAATSLEEALGQPRGGAEYQHGDSVDPQFADSGPSIPLYESDGVTVIGEFRGS